MFWNKKPELNCHENRWHKINIAKPWRKWCVRQKEKAKGKEGK